MKSVISNSYEKNKNKTEKLIELIKLMMNKKQNQSFIKLGLIVIFLRQVANIQISIYDKELKPKGRPTTVSLNRPAKKTKR